MIWEQMVLLVVMTTRYCVKPIDKNWFPIYNLLVYWKSLLPNLAAHTPQKSQCGNWDWAHLWICDSQSVNASCCGTGISWNIKKWMICLMSEITDEVNFDQQDHHLHLCLQMKHVWWSALLRRTSWIWTHLFRSIASPTLATRLTNHN